MLQKYALSLGEKRTKLFEQWPRASYRSVFFFVYEYQFYLTSIQQFPQFIQHLKVKLDADSRQFFQYCLHRQKVVESGWFQVCAVHIYHGHQYAAKLHVFVGNAKASQGFHPASFIHSWVVSMIYIAHLIGVGVADADDCGVGEHGECGYMIM